HRLLRRVHDLLQLRGGNRPTGEGWRVGNDDHLRSPDGVGRCSGGRAGARTRPPRPTPGSGGSLIVLGVFLAGGAGAIARYLVDAFVQRRPGTSFPYGVLVINVSGSLLLGLL